MRKFRFPRKRAPDFPEWLIQGGVTVEPLPGTVLNISARHISSRQTNFINSESVPGYTVYNAYVDIGDGFSTGPFKALKARINLDNIFDKDYLGTITTTTNTAAFIRPGAHPSGHTLGRAVSEGRDRRNAVFSRLLS